MSKRHVLKGWSCLFASLCIAGCNVQLPDVNNDAGTMMTGPEDSGVVPMGPALTSFAN